MRALIDQKLLDVLDGDMKCYQLENRTIFRFKTSEPQQLLYNEKDDFSSEIMSVFLPNGHIEQMSASGNILYFSTNDRVVFKIVTDPLLAVRFHRSLNENETVTTGGIISLPHFDQQAVHRIEYNNYNKIIVSTATMKSGGKVCGIHRSKVVFVWKDRDGGVGIEALGENAIVLSVPRSAGEFYCNDASPFIYVPEQSNIFVLNTDTMEPLVALQAIGLYNMSIISVRGDLITLAANTTGDRFLMTAKLPEGYFDSNDRGRKRSSTPEETSVKDDWETYCKNKREKFRETLNDPINDPDFWNYKECDDEGSGKTKPEDVEFPHNNDFFKAFNSKMAPKINKASNIYVKRAWDEDFKMNETVNDLLDKNAVLETQIDDLKKGKGKSRNNDEDEMLKSFTESNEKLMKDNEQLEVNNKESQQSVARATALNEEITAANDQLNEELAMMQEKEEEQKEKLKSLRDRYNRLLEEKGKLSSTLSDKKREIRERLENIISENKKLRNSLSGRSNKARIKELFVENEQIIKTAAYIK